MLITQWLTDLYCETWIILADEDGVFGTFSTFNSRWTCTDADPERLRRSQSLKSNLVSRLHISGLFGPPKKCGNFEICNKLQKCFFYLPTLSHCYFFCPPAPYWMFCVLCWLVHSALWFPQLSKLPSFLISQLFFPLKLSYLVSHAHGHHELWF